MLRVFDADTLASVLSHTALLAACEDRLVAGAASLPESSAQRHGMWFALPTGDGPDAPHAISGAIADALVDAALATIASKHLAVAAPRSIGLIGGGLGATASLAAHLAFYGSHLEIRTVTASNGLAIDLPKGLVAKAMPVHRAVACDVVCVHMPVTISRTWLCDGSHLNLLATGALIDDVTGLSFTGASDQTDSSDIPAPLALVSRGVTAGRESGEITVYRPTALERSLGLGALADLIRQLPAERGTLFDVGGPH